MSLSVNEQVKYWGIALLVFIVTLWVLGDVLLPFVAGMAIAYFLDPVADRLERMKFSRVAATTIITLSALFFFILMIVSVVPLLTKQLSALLSSIPDYFEQLKLFLNTRFPDLLNEASFINQAMDTAIEIMRSKGGEMANAVLASAFTMLDAVIFLVVAPVVAFYMLLDWDRMIAAIDSWVPRDHLQTVRNLATEVDNVLAGFVRGQMTVCAILGVFYAVALVVVGLQFGLVVGLVAGLLTFIPYVGSLIGGLLSIGLALFQFWDQPVWIAAVAGIFVVGQMIEGNYLTPKLVGSSVGLHPVWLMFALSAFGSFMGFTGMLIAVPVTAMIGVFSRFGIRQYLSGRLYTGVQNSGEQDDG